MLAISLETVRRFRLVHIISCRIRDRKVVAPVLRSAVDPSLKVRLHEMAKTFHGTTRPSRGAFGGR